MFPYRVRFAKFGKLRFLSHHDLMRLIERALRRSSLPIKMTEGFNPHPRLSFPIALGIGIESADEIMEVELTAWIAPKQVERQLNEQFPEGINIVNVEPFHRKQSMYVDYVEYEVAPKESPDDLDRRILALLEKKEAVVQRTSDKGSKPVDVRKYLMTAAGEGGKIYLRIRVTNDGTAKPEEVLELLGVRGSIRKTFTELKPRMVRQPRFGGRRPPINNVERRQQ